MSTSKKFIPNGDADFVAMGRQFAAALSRDPATFGVPPEESAALDTAVQRFEVALREARGGVMGKRSSSKTLTLRKDEARKQAETLVRRVAGAVRSNDQIAASDKAKLGIAPRKKAGQAAKENQRDATAALKTAPQLSFLGAMHRAGCVPEHELRFTGFKDGPGVPKALLPAGRLELFFELVPPDEAIPEVPGGSGFGVHYLRSFVKSPIVLRPPMADRPMRVVYWARWADARGEVGPMGQPAAGWVEGGSHHLIGLQSPGSANMKPAEVNTACLAEVAAKLPRMATLTDQRPEKLALDDASLSDTQRSAA
ncbi:MAG: hypothetical protein AAGF84_04120 [Planctomycetota bacterium]